MGDMIREVEERSHERKDTVHALVDKLTDMVDNPDNAIVLVPLIKEYLEIDTDNDKHYVDLLKILEKLYKTKVNADDITEAGDLSEDIKTQIRSLAEDEDSSGMADTDKEELIEDVRDDTENVFEDEELQDLENRTADALDEIDNHKS
jgi:hypothetical protein